MPLHTDVWAVINGSGTSVRRTRDGRKIRSLSFRGLPISKHEEINALIAHDEEINMIKALGTRPVGLRHVRDSAQDMGQMLTTNLRTNRSLLHTFEDAKSEQKIQLLQKTGRGDGSRTVDSVDMRMIGPSGAGSGLGGVSNPVTGEGMHGVDPSVSTDITPNIWLSPQEAWSLYSQKGIFEMVIQKKSQSILLNGVKIKNPKLSPEQLKRVNENAKKKGFDRALANAVRDSLVFGGALLFPMFRKDNAVTTSLSISALAALGVVGKDCVDYFRNLDRWNAVNIPNWNPTAKDFFDPAFYYVPFLGADLHGSRCSRIVTSPQAGYWGTLATYGWGISDFVGYAQSGFNYRTTVQTIPTMIRQMSILVRQLNVDGALATEGNIMLKEMFSEDTVRYRETSMFNPINMDIMGELKAVDRNFQQVPELLRLLRQDFAGNARTPEELIWSSERGAFSSGDQTDGAFEKQSESIRFIHKEVGEQAKRMGKIMVIDALGLDRDVLRNLDYTYVELDEPRVTNAKDRADLVAAGTKGVFDLTASGMKVDTAISIVSAWGGDEFEVDHELMNEVELAQAIKDHMDVEMHNAELDQMEASTDAANNPPAPSAGGSGAGGAAKKPVAPKHKPGRNEKKGHSYSDRLEQKQHERVGKGKREGLQKAAGKLK